MCGLEALGIAARWTYPSQISRTPIYAYAVVLFFDFILYSVLAAMVIESNHKTNTPVISTVKCDNSYNTNTYSYHNNSGDNYENNAVNSTGDLNNNFTDPAAPLSRRAIALGLRTLQILGSAFSVVLREASNLLGYCWGRDVHTYASVQQHHQQQSNIEMYDTITPRRVQVSKSLDELGTRVPRFSPKKSGKKNSFSVSGPTTPRFSPALSSNQSIYSHIDWSSEINTIDVGTEVKGLERKENENGNGRKTSKIVTNTVNNGRNVRSNDEENDAEGKRDGSVSNDKENGNRKSDGRDEGNRNQRDQTPHTGIIQTSMRILDLSKEYGTDSTGVVILHRVCAELRQGTVTCLLGSNGAGKTTLMRILCGLDSQYTGEVTLTAEHPVDPESDPDSYSARTAQSAQSPMSLNHPVSPRTDQQTSFFEIERNGDLEVESGRDSSLSVRLGGTTTTDNDVDNPTSDVSILHHALSICTVRWWRELGLFFVVRVIRVFSRVHRFLRRQKQYFLSPHRRELRRCVGWCSQEDALFDYLTVQEHVELFDDLLGGINEMGTSLYADDIQTDSTAEGEGGTGEKSSREVDSLTTLQKIWKWILNLFLESRSRSTIRSAQAVLIARLGMEEHAGKFALELSGAF